jgi:hypothetical protein
VWRHALRLRWLTIPPRLSRLHREQGLTVRSLLCRCWTTFIRRSPPFATGGRSMWPVRRRQADVIDLWPATLSLGQPLPTLPLFLGVEVCLPIDLEITYMEACRRLKLV